MNEPDPRPRLAYDRTILANERTFAAWLRTALATAAVGVAAAHFIDPGEGPVGPFLIGALFVLVGIMILGLGAWRYAQVNRDLATAGSPRAVLPPAIVFALSAVVALLLGGLLFAF